MTRKSVSMASMDVIPMDVLQMNLKHRVEIVPHEKTSEFAAALLCHRGSHWLLSPSKWAFNALSSGEEPFGSTIQVQVLDLGELRSRAKHKPKQKESYSSLEHFVAAMLLPAACFMACVGIALILPAMIFSELLRESYGIAQKTKADPEGRRSILREGGRIEYCDVGKLLGEFISSAGPSHIHLLENHLFKNTKVVSCRGVDSEEKLHGTMSKILDGQEYKFYLLPMELRKGSRRDAERHCVALLFDRDQKKVLLIDEGGKRLQEHSQLVLDFGDGSTWKGKDVHKVMKEEVTNRPGWQYKRKDDNGGEQDLVLYRLPECKVDADQCRCPRWVIAATLAYERGDRDRVLQKLQDCGDPADFIREYSSRPDLGGDPRATESEAS